MITSTETAGLYRLLAWLSPSFPIGAFSYSHGLEAAVADGAVHDRASLEAWIAAIVARGSGRIDADLLCRAHRAAAAGDDKAVAAANGDGAAFRATAELALESAQQGEAFAQTCRAAWSASYVDAAGKGTKIPSPPFRAERDGPTRVGEWQGEMGAGQRSGTPHRIPSLSAPAGGEVATAIGKDVCHSAAFGSAAARAEMTLEDALVGYLQSFAGNLISAGLRLGVVGQTDGQRILAALEAVVTGAAAAALTRAPEDFGAATFAADIASMAHETQYTRLFRS